MKRQASLSVAVCAALLASAANAQDSDGERGRDGELNIIFWQAASTLNPYLSGGIKDWEASSLVLEPLARFDETGTPVPYLAEEIPTVENGGVAEDFKSITWTLKDGLKWSDGTPVTSKDVKFTAQYCMDPDGGCAQLAEYEGVEDVEILDDLTVKVHFDAPHPYPYTAFMTMRAPIIQEAQFADCLGAKAPTCTEANFNPIGTGPFVVTDFRPNDVIQMTANPNFRDSSKPAFATLNFKGGGDAYGAARAVLETGEYDYAWNLQLAPDVLANLEEGGKGKAISSFGTSVERIEINLTDPSPSLPEGERSTAAHPHPFLSDVRVRKALSLALDRETLVEIGYGDAGRPTCDLIPAPPLYASDNDWCLEQDLDQARALLDEAGWKDTDGDGVRDKDGVKLQILYQTSTNAVRQDFQALAKDWWSQIGIETELRNIDASVYFGADPSSPDTTGKFYADLEEYSDSFNGTDPQSYLAQRRCGAEPKPANNWQGENAGRFCSEEYDALLDELATTADREERGEISKQLNDIFTKEEVAIIPLLNRGTLSGKSNTLGGVKLNSWDGELWNVADWYRKDE